ncbi:MAG: glycosyltransferase family 4 protein [Dysgonamonadaceae bacterium]|jgi:glycosyltransferase involved in cell wall biosynthesis|nr:glycosyltransferase family 4 protein [Dysgonamonadaceae bacterium]
MNILLIHQYFLEENDPGGSRWNEMTKMWTEKGHKVTVLAGMMHYTGTQKKQEYKGKFCVKKQQGNVTVWRSHVSESYNKNFVGRLWGYFSFVFSSIYAGLFKVRDKYDLIIVTSPPLFVGVTAYVLSVFKRIPFVFEIRDLWPESAIDTGVLTNKAIIKMAYWFESFIYKKAKLINVLTPAFRTKLIEEKNVPPEKIIFIPNAADFSLSDGILNSFDREEFRKQHDLNDHFVITYVGAHGVANHLEQILNTAARLKDTNVLFLLIGEGMEKEKLKKMAMKKQLDNVRFIDAVPKADVFKYILASDMGTSVLKKVDTFKTIYSNKTFDYMACKKPILMAIDGVSRELLEAANAGSFVEPENDKDFEQKIREYLANPQRLIVEGESGYDYAKANFDREVLADKYIGILEELK